MSQDKTVIKRQLAFGQALQSGQRFSPIPLLNTDVDVV